MLGLSRADIRGNVRNDDTRAVGIVGDEDGVEDESDVGHERLDWGLLGNWRQLGNGEVQHRRVRDDRGSNGRARCRPAAEPAALGRPSGRPGSGCRLRLRLQRGR